jgi:GxxExxY protein
MNGKFKYAEITEKVIGCAMRVHSVMKNGHRENVYQRCMAIELEKAGLNFKLEADMPIYFGDAVVGRRRVDFLIAESIPVEIKAHANLEKEHLAQAINNLETHHLEVGLLINFGSKSLQFRRLYNNRWSPTAS